MSRKLCMWVAVGAVVAIGGCRPAAKAPVHDTFTRVGSAEAITPLAYGATSKVVKTRGDYGWFRFDGRAGDNVDIRVKSPNGDAVAFVLDRDDDVIAVDDDSDPFDSDSHVVTTIPVDGTYYIAFREYSFAPATFTVTLTARAPISSTDVSAQ